MSASSGSTASSASISPRTACAPARAVVPTPPGIATLPNNKGLEALAFAPRGSKLAGTLIAFSERGLDAAGNLKAFLIGGPTPGEFSVKRRDDFDISDCTVLPAGDLLLLERRFSLLRGGIAMRLRRIAARRHHARRGGRRADPDLRRHGLPDRQHGRAFAPTARPRAISS